MKYLRSAIQRTLSLDWIENALIGASAVKFVDCIRPLPEGDSLVAAILFLVVALIVGCVNVYREESKRDMPDHLPKFPPPGAPRERKLSPLESLRFQQWAEKNKAHGACVFCETKNWILNDGLVEVRPFFEGGSVFGGAVIPLIMLACSNCGHVEFVSALASGVISQPNPSASDAKPKQS